jgi:hypothetical protein
MKIASLLRIVRTSTLARAVVSGLMGGFLLLTAASPSALASSGTVSPVEPLAFAAGPTAGVDGATVLKHHHHHHHHHNHHHGDSDDDRDDN